MENAGTQIVSRRSLTLELPPSCLEFSPLLPSYFLVGTYNLQTSGEEAGEHEPSVGPQRRNGSIVVYEVAGQDIVHVHTESRPAAILDLRFQTCSGKEDIVGVVSSTATLELFRFSSSLSGPPSLTLLGTLRLPGIGEDVLFLQFAWHPTIPDTVAIVTSQGGVHILQVGSDYRTSLATEDPIILHSLEAWCVTLSPTVSITGQSEPPAFTIYTGGDDSLLQYATCIVKEQLPQDDASLSIELPHSPVSVRGHDAGVTAILPLPCGNDIVVTGSYDDHIRVYSIQPLHETLGLRKASLLAETNLGGGVWRLRLIKCDRGGQGRGAGTWKALILASCMHAGARIVQIRGSDDNIGNVELEILGRFEEHKSMNYASDFQPGTNVDGPGELVCVSTSFYDKLLCLWTFKLG
ncbi:hypothetical protein CONLIGDRAFT_656110 [Coniochaeta ligniaria NRRL 30616]|uniref:WD40 repeat-like protein n=1 Tax=Coniochaeta ligniaria NRRL 30616 TaxID=1408157 RepID=A0A1J7IGG6_9PEZI|nr:hypothetical protein CONLIGDRAFT_656110 [Coniochaeta ligniaria NRRL 30616]